MRALMLRAYWQAIRSWQWPACLSCVSSTGRRVLHSYWHLGSPGASSVVHKPKNPSVWGVVFSFSMKQWTISERKSVFYMTTSNDQLSGWAEKKLQELSKAKLAPKKCHGHCLVVCCQSDPLQLSESWRNHYIWEVCSANQWNAPKIATPAASYWSTERAQFFSMTMPNHVPQQSFKSGMNWTMKFCLTHHIHLTSHQWTTTSATISTILCKESASTTNRRQKMLSKNLLNPKVCFFNATEINKHFLLAKVCWL